MGRPRKPMPWIPLQVHKWLDGSTRDELTHAERAIFSDFLCMAAKTGGYIAANVEDGIPYTTRRLAKILGSENEAIKVTQELVEATIDKCILHGKLKLLDNGILEVVKWDDYQLSDSYKRVLKHREKKRGEKNRGEDRVTETVTPVTKPSDFGKRIGKLLHESLKRPYTEPVKTKAMSSQQVLARIRQWGKRVDEFVETLKKAKVANPEKEIESVMRAMINDYHEPNERGWRGWATKVKTMVYFLGRFDQLFYSLKDTKKTRAQDEEKVAEQRSKKIEAEWKREEAEAKKLDALEKTDPLAWAEKIIPQKQRNKASLLKLRDGTFSLKSIRKAAGILLKELKEEK